ncbi:hypothetical protein [Streptomyces olivochromogenes]|uniref:hypothetical protein n=1 Tax=Streptomyces olivochromogenes TaxID=1963 RepID=UPI001F266F89|nr:hypothetical protein [Streptomyces olivochromogenes]MCF3129807.1 hypothetical protein [Streptomyces olivochromogenes]
MGTDIHGWIECRTWGSDLEPGETAWQPAITLSMLGMPRDYEAFACLFGVRDFSGLWRPIAANRGLPPDTSQTIRTELESWGDAAFGTTWLDWPEVESIDWTEPAVPRTTRIAQYRRHEDGTLHLIHPSIWTRAFARATGINTLTLGPTDIADLHPEGTEWQSGTTLYRAERDRRQDAVPKDGPWQPVWTVMKTLATIHGSESVRLVAWFDE